MQQSNDDDHVLSVGYEATTLDTLDTLAARGHLFRPTAALIDRRLHTLKPAAVRDNIHVRIAETVQADPDQAFEVLFMLHKTVVPTIAPDTMELLCHGCSHQDQRIAAASYLSKLRREASHPALAIQATQTIALENFGIILHLQDRLESKQYVIDKQKQMLQYKQSVIDNLESILDKKETRIEKQRRTIREQNIEIAVLRGAAQRSLAHILSDI